MRETGDEDIDNFIYRIGVDIGGTKAAVGLVAKTKREGRPVEFKVLDSLIMPTFIKRDLQEVRDQRECEIKLKEDLEARDCFLTRLSSLISQIVCQNSSAKIAPWLGIGTCGYILEGRIVPETAPMLGAAFSNFSFQEWGKDLLKRLFPYATSAEAQVFVHNDALAQMACGIHLLLQEDDQKKDGSQGQNARHLLNSRVAYIGPGTGLGGGFAKVNDVGEMNFFTDGHIGDMILGKDEQTQANLNAEDYYLSGYYIEKELGMSGLELSERWEEHIPFIKKLGQNLGKIIENIHEGNVYKTRAATHWNDEDRQAVRGIKVFILGGSLATKGELGKLIQNEAKKFVQTHLDQIILLPIPELSEHAGIIGATLFNS